jgi:hypothetical protein
LSEFRRKLFENIVCNGCAGVSRELLGAVWEPRGGDKATVGSHYQGIGEDTADREDLVHAIVNCRLCRSVNSLLLAAASCKHPINLVTNP